jgi:hypothetical protein
VGSSHVTGDLGLVLDPRIDARGREGVLNRTKLTIIASEGSR